MWKRGSLSKRVFKRVQEKTKERMIQEKFPDPQDTCFQKDRLTE